MRPLSGQIAGQRRLLPFGGQTLQKLGLVPAHAHFHVAVADLNGDGVLDLAVANSDGTLNQVAVHLGNYDGSFQDPAFLTAGEEPRSVAIDDFNGDGAPDLVTANDEGRDVSVFLGAGDGTFSGSLNAPVYYSPIQVLADDLDLDGRTDLAVLSSGRIAVLLGDGDGTFQQAEFTTTTSNPRAMAIADLDGDELLDLVVAGGSSESQLAVHPGIGDGDFGPATFYDLPNGLNAVAIGDLDGDTIPDLALTQYPETLLTMRGLGDGSFQTGGSYPVGGYPRAVALGDLDGDATIDILVANGNDENVSVYSGLGDGTFSERNRFGVGSSPGSVALSDFNGDGGLDLAVTNSRSQSRSVFLLFNATVAPLGTIDAVLQCTPASGTLPFEALISVALENRYPDQYRQVAARLGVELANGQSFPAWRSGSTTLDSGSSFSTVWSQPFPAFGSLVGENTFRLIAEDVTPEPYNQPPYPPSGDKAGDRCTVTGAAP